MEQTISVIPWKEILTNPGSAWAVVFILLLIFVMYQNGKREDRLMEIINGTLKDMTEALTSVKADIREVKDDIDSIRRNELP